MSRISIEVTPEEHKKLKTIAALKGKSIKDFVIERTLGSAENQSEDSALRELELILDQRIREAEKGRGSSRKVETIFQEAYRKARRK